MKSMWVTAFFLKCHVGYVTLENFGMQFPWQPLRYPIAFNTCDKLGYNVPIFTQNSKSHDLWVTAVSPEAFI